METEMDSGPEIKACGRVFMSMDGNQVLHKTDTLAKFPGDTLLQVLGVPKITL